MPEIDRLPRILPSSLPLETLENLAKVLGYTFPNFPHPKQRQIDDFMNSLASRTYVWGSALMRGEIGPEADPNAVERLDVLGHPLEQKDDGKAVFHVFLLLSPGFTFSITAQRQRRSGFDITNLEVHPRSCYEQIVQCARCDYLERQLGHLYETSLMGSTPLQYADFLAAIDALSVRHPALASGRDARMLKDGSDPAERAPIRPAMSRGRT